MLFINQKRNLARLTLSVLLAIFCSVTTWATGGYLSGHGTQNDPYIIADVADWNKVAQYMAQTHTDYISKYYKLSNNFDNASTPVTTMMGDLNHPFIGYFDGNNRILAVNIIGPQATDGASDTSAQGAAPFRKILGATIENLTVQGYVNGQGYYAAGLVGICSDNCTIKNCTVQTQVSGADYVGGIVGYGAVDSQLTLNNCVSAGYYSSFATFAGGLVGWCGAMEFTCNNCLFKGSFSTANGGQYHPIILANNGSSVTASLQEVYYLYQWASTVDEQSNHLVAHADGFAVSDTKVSGQWDNPVKAADGKTYYMAASGTSTEIPAPTNLRIQLTPGNGTEAMLYWTQPDETMTMRWEVCLNDDEANTVMVGNSVNVNGLCYMFTNLTPEQTYTAKVRAWVGTKSSEWSESITFQPTAKLIIGSGSETNDLLPSNTYYKYSLTQQIYTAEELGDATAFKSIDFYSTATERTRNLDIYMVSTDKSSFTYDDGNKSNDWVSVSANDLVFSGEVTFKQNEWTTILLDYPYIHDGQNNMVLVVDDNTGSDLSNPTFYVFDAPGQAIRIFSDVNNYDPTSPSSYTGTVLNVKNQIRLQRGEAPPCTKPTNLTVEYTGGNTAVVSWTSGEPRFDLLVNDELIVNVTSPHTLENLNWNTEYVIQVRAKNDQGSSDWTKEVKFTTDASDNMCFVSLDLTDSYGDGWNGNAIQVYGVTYDRVFGECTVPSDSKTAHFDVKVPQGENLQFIWKKGSYGEECSWVITDAFGEEIHSMEKGGAKDLEDGTVLATFVVDCVESPWKRPTDFTVSEIGPRSAVLNWTENGEATEWVISLSTGGGEVAQYLTTFKPFTIPDLNPETTYVVKVKPNADDGTEKWSNELTFTTLIAAPAPTDLTITEIGPNTATAAWQGFGNSYDVRYAPYREDLFSWLQYDNGTYVGTIGNSNESTWTWGVMYPGSMVLSNKLTNVSIYETSGSNTKPITVNIYSGGDDAPGTLLYTQEVTPLAANAFHEVTLDQPVNITPGENLWITLTETGTWVMAYCQIDDATNSQWVLIGDSWQPIGDLVSDFADVGWMIRACLETANFDDIEWTTLTTTQHQAPITQLTPETTYVAQVRGDYGQDGKSEWATTVFTTLTANPVPFNLAAEPAVNSATLSWTGFGDSYDLKYLLSNARVYDFDNSTFDGWTTIDADGDDNTWELGSAPVSYFAEGVSLLGTGHNQSNDFVLSGSFSNLTNQALTPDNYLVSPKVELGGSISFWACAQDGSYPTEHFGVAVSTTGNTDAADFTTIQEWDMTAARQQQNRGQGNWYQFTVDLSAFSGKGYVAIRHFDCTDQFILNVDDIVIIEPSASDWITVTGIKKSPYVLTGLNPNTTYQYQIQSVKGSNRSSWSDLSWFTTQEFNISTAITDVTVSVNDGHWYSIDGKRLNERPKAKGLYIHNGQKVVVK